MAVYAGRTFTRSGGLVGAITHQLRTVTLKPLKKIDVTFDPFGENAKDIREFMFFISSPKVRQTNPSCPIRANVVNDRSEPNIVLKLINGENLIFRSGNLTTLELFKLLNNYVTPLAPVEEVEAPVATKGSRPKGKGMKKKKFN
ncbi:hypothetical protein PR048_017517 [Dryococelus australis]|uniref:Large ribosomal subunit protein mL53 n=1 Tax=Dryococelus australis TaxID=614101 RepID=A0ABQ9H9S8_9NEOP|nr:hypothetical protein PR048_017517 [Dryococelus australis]